MNRWEYQVVDGDSAEDINFKLEKVLSEGWMPTSPLALAGTVVDGDAGYRYAVMVGRPTTSPTT